MTSKCKQMCAVTVTNMLRISLMEWKTSVTWKKPIMLTLKWSSSQLLDFYVVWREIILKSWCMTESAETHSENSSATTSSAFTEASQNALRNHPDKNLPQCCSFAPHPIRGQWILTSSTSITCEGGVQEKHVGQIGPEATEPFIIERTTV